MMVVPTFPVAPTTATGMAVAISAGSAAETRDARRDRRAARACRRARTRVAFPTRCRGTPDHGFEDGRRPAATASGPPAWHRVEMRRPRDRHGHGRRAASGQKSLITGGDSGIGRAVAIGFAKEGADVAILYLDEHRGREGHRGPVEAEGRRAMRHRRRRRRRAVLPGGGEAGGRASSAASTSWSTTPPSSISARISRTSPTEQVERTFRTNILGQLLHDQSRAAAPASRAARSSTRPRSPPTGAVRS